MNVIVLVASCVPLSMLNAQCGLPHLLVYTYGLEAAQNSFFF